MESIPLKNIQNIENTLSKLRFKIQKMVKTDQQNQQTISRLILSTVSIVDKKIKENQTEQNILRKKNQHINRSYSIKRKNQESRLINQKQITRSKELITLMKHHNSQHLKQSKRHNDNRIKQFKQICTAEKRQKIAEIKKQENEARSRIEQFHNKKKAELKLKKQQENKQKQQKVRALLLKMKQLGQQQLQMQKKINLQEQNIRNYRGILKKVDKIKCQDFINLRHKVQAQKPEDPKSLSEAILIFATRNQSTHFV